MPSLESHRQRGHKYTVYVIRYSALSCPWFGPRFIIKTKTKIWGADRFSSLSHPGTFLHHLQSFNPSYLRTAGLVEKNNKKLQFPPKLTDACLAPVHPSISAAPCDSHHLQPPHYKVQPALGIYFAFVTKLILCTDIDSTRQRAMYMHMRQRAHILSKLRHGHVRPAENGIFSPSFLNTSPSHLLQTASGSYGKRQQSKLGTELTVPLWWLL